MRKMMRSTLARPRRLSRSSKTSNCRSLAVEVSRHRRLRRKGEMMRKRRMKMAVRKSLAHITPLNTLDFRFQLRLRSCLNTFNATSLKR